MSTTNGKVVLSPDLARGGSPLVSPAIAVSPTAPRHEASFGRVLWDAWKAYTKRAGGYQGQVLLSTVYFAVLGPSTVLAHLTRSKLLDLSTKPRSSYWIERPPVEKTLTAMGRQF